MLAEARFLTDTAAAGQTPELAGAGEEIQAVEWTCPTEISTQGSELALPTQESLKTQTEPVGLQPELAPT